MPSIEREKRLRHLLDQPGLTPQQAKDVEQEMERFGRNEDARHVGMAQSDIATEDERRTSAEEKLSQYVVNDVSPRMEDVRHGRLSSRELVALRDEIQQVVHHFEGDGRQKPGFLASLDEAYDRADAVIADPGAAADAFWKKWGGSLDRWSVKH